MEVPNWRIRSDDHLVHVLQFVAHLCDLRTAEAAGDAGRFLDANVLNWLGQFSDLVTERSPVPFFASSALLTNAAVEELRTLLERVTGVERPVEVEEPVHTVYNLYDGEQERPFLPGTGEGW